MAWWMSQIHSTDAAGLTTFSLFMGLCIGKKESLAKRLNLHRATLPLFLWGFKASASSGALIVHMCTNATSVHKPHFRCGYFFARLPAPVKTS
jgi:hypothetical protein